MFHPIEDLLSERQDFDVSTAIRLGRAANGYALYEHPRYGDEFPIVAVNLTTGEKFNTWYFDIEDARGLLAILQPTCY